MKQGQNAAKKYVNERKEEEVKQVKKKRGRKKRKI